MTILSYLTLLKKTDADLTGFRAEYLLSVGRKTKEEIIIKNIANGTKTTGKKDEFFVTEIIIIRINIGIGTPNVTIHDSRFSFFTMSS